MQPLLTVTRENVDGTHTSHTLFRDDMGSFVVADETHRQRTLPGARDPLDAIRRSKRLHTATAHQETHYRILEPAAFSETQILDTIVATGEPDADLDWDEYGDPLFYVFDEGHHIWSTLHRISLNGRPVYATPSWDPSPPPHGRSGRNVVVTGEDYTRPYDSWDDLAAYHWDSSDYAGVGMAGYGVEGVYLLRPGILAVVSATDESLTVAIERVSRAASRRTLATRALLNHFWNDRALAHLVLAAYGFTADDLYPGDSVSTALDATDLRRLLTTRPPVAHR